MRRPYLLALILAVIALVVLTRGKFRPRPPAPPEVRLTKPPPPVAPPPAPAPPPPAADPEAATRGPEPEKAAPTGWLNVRLDFGGEPGPEKLHFRVLSWTGSEKSEELPGAESVKLGPLTAGEKAVFIYPGSSSFGAAAVLAKVVEQAEVDVFLKIPKAFPVSGVVMDNTGRPVPGMTVQIEELIPLEFKQSDKPRTWSGGFRGGSIMSAGRRSVTWHHSFLLTDKGIRFKYDASTDEQGQFLLHYGASPSAVTLSVLRKDTVILQESRVPSGEPLRLVIPVQEEEEPKK